MWFKLEIAVSAVYAFLMAELGALSGLLSLPQLSAALRAQAAAMNLGPAQATIIYLGAASEIYFLSRFWPYLKSRLKYSRQIH